MSMVFSGFRQYPKSGPLAFGIVVLNLCEHTEPLRSFPSFCQTLFLPNLQKVKWIIGVFWLWC